MKLIGIAIAAVVALFFLGSSANSIFSDIKSQVSSFTSGVSDLLPAGDAYGAGLEEGRKILENTDYLDQMNISLLPGASQLIQSVKDGQITEERITELANLYFPVAAVKAGIVNLSAENRAEFVRGVVEGYFAKGA
jgi:hypothetical protein